MAKSKFDVFLCHNSADRRSVSSVGRALQKRGIRVWLDAWNLRPGLPWQSILEAEIATIKSAAVFVGRNGLGPWQNEEIAAFLREFVRRGCPVIPTILAGARAPKLPVFLSGMTWVNFNKREPAPLDLLAWGITGLNPACTEVRNG